VTVYFGERDLVEGRFLADRILDCFETSGLEAAALLRGVEGFGPKHGLRTDRLLTSSEDLPIVAIGVGEQEAVGAATAEIGAVSTDALITVDTVALARSTEVVEEPAGRWLKASVFLGRGRRVNAIAAHEAVVARLRAAGVEGATVLLGVDGLLGGARQRAGFFSRNIDVPALVVSVGSADAVTRGLSSLRALPGERVVTVECAHIHKRDGVLLGPPEVTGARGSQGPERRKLTLYSSEQAHFGGRPVHIEAVRRLRAAGAEGATALRGVWGFDGANVPHGDTFRSLRRRVPTVTEVIDTSPRVARWLEVLDEITPRRGLITSEIVGAPVSRR
jgi:PII-like signaling protein